MGHQKAVLARATDRVYFCMSSSVRGISTMLTVLAGRHTRGRLPTRMSLVRRMQMLPISTWGTSQQCPGISAVVQVRALRGRSSRVTSQGAQSREQVWAQRGESSLETSQGTKGKVKFVYKSGHKRGGQVCAQVWAQRGESSLCTSQGTKGGGQPWVQVKVHQVRVHIGVRGVSTQMGAPGYKRRSQVCVQVRAQRGKSSLCTSQGIKGGGLELEYWSGCTSG